MTPEDMKAWEDRLGPEKVNRAIAIMRSNGWGPGTEPPMWCWAMAFRMVEGQIPEEWGTGPRDTSSFTRELLGFNLL